jgi:vesicle transport through interaction with t-SNAREs protein 1
MQMLPKLRGYRQDIEQLSHDVKRVPLSSAGALPPYTGYSDDDDFQRMENTQRARLMQGTATLHRASDSLARTHQVAAETDQVADEIVSELGTQRESLLRTRDRLHETDSNLARSRKILNTMMRRVMTNKMILAVIILLELGILGVVIWWKFFKK